MTATLGFSPPPAQVSVASGQQVQVTASAALGSTGGGSGMNLWICYATTSAPTSLTQVGGGSLGLTVAAGQRQLFSLSAVISGLATDTYLVGLCGSGTGFNNNEWGYTSALVFQT
jgi:hypothetical protein